MRYRINFDKTINQLIPHYMGGRRLILYLQSIMKPLQMLNDAFVNYAKETRIEAAMTSQKFKFEWYLKRKLNGLFIDNNAAITINNTQTTGLSIYRQPKVLGIVRPADIEDIVIYRHEETDEGVLPVDAFIAGLRWQSENNIGNKCSFVVHVPAIKEGKEDICIAQLKKYIETYRLANKTYEIEIGEYVDNETRFVSEEGVRLLMENGDSLIFE